ncbi:MAG: LuxR C-terminal-related transcriptional regulator [Acidimicrobiia bacterium]
MADAIELGREAFARREWGGAYTLLGTGGPLEAEDLERLAVAAYLTGRDKESDDAWQRAQAECVRLGDPARAARCAFWLGFALLFRGEMAQASGWLARSQRLLEEAGNEGAVRGFLMLPAYFGALDEGNPAAADAVGVEMVDIAAGCGDKDLLAMGLLSRGKALLALGDATQGMKLLDEVMVSVTTGEVSPILAGIVYCAVIESCMDAFDLHRAAQWTEALYAWCTSQPDLVPYRGQCLVHRSQMLQAHGRWAEAATEAERARQHLAAHPALGMAFYQLGELHRLRGEFPEAERAYREASQQGREPVPGFALLRLAEGRLDAAVPAARRMAEESQGKATRPAILAATVEVFLAAGDAPAARLAADEVAAIARSLDVPVLHAMADHANGSVLLAESDAQGALIVARRACNRWQELGMPYEAARARVLFGLACRALGDHDAVGLELDGARSTFERMGARPDVEHVDELTGAAATRRAGALTDRECEVLRLVAAGRTNRQIAAELVVSEHTVARHLQNMFTKLGLSSRAAATAYAYEHRLV